MSQESICRFPVHHRISSFMANDLNSELPPNQGRRRRGGSWFPEKRIWRSCGRRRPGIVCRKHRISRAKSGPCEVADGQHICIGALGDRLRSVDYRSSLGVQSSRESAGRQKAKFEPRVSPGARRLPLQSRAKGTTLVQNIHAVAFAMVSQ